MPITPNPMPYGFSGADISSIAQARQGMLSGFEELGKTVRNDMVRIGAMRQMQGFGEELQQINPESPQFAQQAAALLSRYPLAASTPAGRAGIELLGNQNQLWTRAQTLANRGEVTYPLGEANPVINGQVFQYGQQGLERVGAGAQPGRITTRTETVMRGGRPTLVSFDTQTGQEVAVLGEPPATASRTPAPSITIDARERINMRGKQAEELRILLTKPDAELRDRYKTDRGTITRQILDLEQEMQQIGRPPAGLDSLGVNAVPPPGATRAEIQASAPLPSGRGEVTESLSLMGPGTAAPLPRVTGARPTPPLPSQPTATGTPAPLPGELGTLTPQGRVFRNEAEVIAAGIAPGSEIFVINPATGKPAKYRLK